MTSLLSSSERQPHLRVFPNSESVVRPFLATNSISRQLCTTIIHAALIGAQLPFLLPGSDSQVLPRVRATLRISLSPKPEDFEIEFANCTDFQFDARNSRLVVSVTESTEIDLVMCSSDVCKKETPIPEFVGMGDVKNEIFRVLKYLLGASENDLLRIRGIMLHGPSGVGKSHVLRSLADWCRTMVESGQRDEIEEEGEQVSNGRTGVPFSEVKSFDLTSRMLSHRQYGENEAEIRRIFVKASQFAARPLARVFVLCDDLPAVVRSKRVIRALGAELDNLHSRVVFVATSDSPLRVDASLRRAGRIDKEIEFGMPSEDQRSQMARHFLPTQALAGDQLDAVVKIFTERTIGYVGADMKVLCEDFADLVGEESSAQPEELAERLVAERRPSILRQSMRYVPVTVPKVHWEDIGGQEDLKRELRECIEWQYQRKADFERFDIRPPKGVLLYGPPGCSKTLCAKALATECRLNFLSVKGPELFSKWVGESEKAVANLFEKARKVSPCILFFDEIDGLAVERGDSGSSAVADRVLSQLLGELDGIRPLSGVTLVAATNRPDLIDTALLRPGRIDRMIYVGPPNSSSRVEILRLYINKMEGNQISEDAIRECAIATKGYSGAELCAIVRESAYLALSEVFDSESEAGQEDEVGEREEKLVVVTDEHLRHAHESISTQLTPETIAFYQDFKRSLEPGGGHFEASDAV